MATLKSGTGLDYCFWHDDQADLVSGDSDILGTAPTWQTDGALIGSSGFATASGATHTDCSAMMGVSSLSVVAIAKPGTLGTRQSLFEFATNSVGFSTGFGDSDQVFAYFDNTTYATEGNNGYFAANTEANFGMRLDYNDGTAQARFYKNGSSVYTVNFTGSATVSGSGDNNACWIGSVATGDVGLWVGHIKMIAMWGGAATRSDAQMQTITADPEGELFEGAGAGISDVNLQGANRGILRGVMRGAG